VTTTTLVIGIVGAMLTASGWGSNPGGTPIVPPPPPVLELIEGSDPPALDPTCRPTVPAPVAEPWSSELAAASEEIWLSKADERSLPYLPGEDGFVFWGDVQNNNIAQAVGRRMLDRDELSLWIDSMRYVRDALKAEGVEFVIVPGPGKWDIYPERLPEWARSIDGSGPLDQILLAAPDLPIIDLRADLRAAAVSTPVYSVVDSHWSDYGAWVGWQTIVRCLSTVDSRFTSLEVPAITGVDFIVGGNEFLEWGFDAPRPDWSVPVLQEPLNPVVVTVAGRPREVRGDEQRIGFLELPAVVLNSSAPLDETALFLRDSMGTSLTPWLQQNFTEVRQMRHNFEVGDPSAIPNIASEARAAGASIVILELAQRHLNQPPNLIP
jgi:hypothetical protein